MSFVPATANRDLWTVLGVMVTASVLLQWWSRRESTNPGEIVGECADGSVIGTWR